MRIARKQAVQHTALVLREEGTTASLLHVANITEMMYEVHPIANFPIGINSIIQFSWAQDGTMSSSMQLTSRYRSAEVRAEHVHACTASVSSRYVTLSTVDPSKSNCSVSFSVLKAKPPTSAAAADRVVTESLNQQGLQFSSR